jgi:hypothetical protein
VSEVLYIDSQSTTMPSRYALASLRPGKYAQPRYGPAVVD